MKSKFISLKKAKLSKDQQRQATGGIAIIDRRTRVICTFNSGLNSRSSIYNGWAEAYEACSNPPSGFICGTCEAIGTL